MQVYDDFLKPEIAQEAYEFVLKSYYQIGWEDSLVPEQRTYPNLHSRYNSEDIKKLNILGPIHKKLKNKNLICDKCIVNLTKPLDINFIHSHPNQVVGVAHLTALGSGDDSGFRQVAEESRNSLPPHQDRRYSGPPGSMPGPTIHCQSCRGSTDTCLWRLSHDLHTLRC